MSDDNKNGSVPQRNWWLQLRSVFTGDLPTRESLLALLRGERWSKVINADEVTMLTGVLKVSETQVREVMIPRSHMVVIERGAPREEVIKTIVESGHSRFPVIGEDRDEVVGILLAKDVLSHIVSSPDEAFDLGPFLRQPTFIPESKRLNTLLKEFRVSRNHIAIVVDEYGGTAGLLTIEDVLEEIVGEIDDEHDPLEAEPIQKKSDSLYQVRALTRIDEFNEYFGIEFSDEEYDTIGGLIIHELGSMPRRGERVFFNGFEFKVVQADRRRVHVLDVTRAEPPADTGTTAET
jgi:magnesium and cobalt transporter